MLLSSVVPLLTLTTAVIPSWHDLISDKITGGTPYFCNTYHNASLDTDLVICLQQIAQIRSHHALSNNCPAVKIISTQPLLLRKSHKDSIEELLSIQLESVLPYRSKLLPHLIQQADTPPVAAIPKFLRYGNSFSILPVLNHTSFYTSLITTNNLLGCHRISIQAIVTSLLPSPISFSPKQPPAHQSCMGVIMTMHCFPGKYFINQLWPDLRKPDTIAQAKIFSIMRWM